MNSEERKIKPLKITEIHFDFVNTLLLAKCFRFFRFRNNCLPVKEKCKNQGLKSLEQLTLIFANTLCPTRIVLPAKSRFRKYSNVKWYMKVLVFPVRSNLF